jgi:ribosomal protein S18 acetylase RimI-like enzyme
MHEVHIRPYQPEDLAPCRALWVELTDRHRELFDDPKIGGEDPGRLFDAHLSEVGPEQVWVAVRRDRPVGFVSLKLSTAASGARAAEVAELVVARASRGCGVGRALLDHAIAEARRLAIRFLSIQPVARNDGAVRLYHAAGFRLVGQLELFIDLGGDNPVQPLPGFRLAGCDFNV